MPKAATVTAKSGGRSVDHKCGRPMCAGIIQLIPVYGFNLDDYQAIYTTSFIPEEYNNSAYCVGDFYTEETPSLKNV